MGSKIKMSRIIGGLLIGGLLLGGTSLAVADNSDSTSAPVSEIRAGMFGKMGHGARGLDGAGLQSVLTTLVASDQITQAQADQIVARQKQLQTERQQQREQMRDMTKAERETLREQNRAEKADLLTQLVTEGTITQEQADAIKNAMGDQRSTQQQERLSTALKGLVEKNVISSQQSTAIVNKMTAMMNDRKAEMEKMRDMTAEQRRQYKLENCPANPLAELVASGVLTQAQADQIQTALGHPGQGSSAGEGMHRGQRGPGCQPEKK